MAGTANSTSLSTNLNVDPFYDDFDQTKNYHRILFRPGLAVQARELTQMQSIMQNQIDRFAEHIFKEGSTVNGFEMNYDIMWTYVRIRDRDSTGTTTITPADFIGKTIQGGTSGVKALVVNSDEGTDASLTGDTKTLYVKYQESSGGALYFANNEILTATDGSGLSANTIVGTVNIPVTGYGVAATFKEGIVYARDHFIRVPAQTLILSKYSRFPSVRVGFDITESIVTEVDDSTLLDPASGAYNYAAPGAARLKLEVTLSKYDLDAIVANTFVELLQTKDGIVQSIANKTQYAQIRDYMAKRTSDESGDYIVSGHAVNLYENLRSGNNQGLFTAAGGGDANKLVVAVAPGKSYVKGYDNETVISTRKSIDKAIDYASIESAKALVDYGNYILVDNVVGKWNLDAQSIVNLKNDQSNSVSTLTYSTTWPTGGAKGTTIGTARVKGLEYYTGTPGAPDAVYKMYLTDVKMYAANSFSQVKGIAYSANTPGKADVRYASANTQDSATDISVFRIPTVATKKLRDTSGNINNDFMFYKTFSQTTSTSGVAAINTGDDNQTFDGGGTNLSQSARRTDFHAVVTSAANTVAAGSVSITSGANTVTGAGGSGFSTKINVGDVLHIGLAGDLVVSQVVSDTQLKVLGTAAATVTSGKYYKKFISGQVVDLGGYGYNGARTVAISSVPSRIATINLNETFNSTGAPLSIIAKVNQIDGQEIAKSVIRDRLVQINIGTGGGTSYVANTSGPWPLGFSDGFKLKSVRKLTGGAPTTFSTLTAGTDVTNDFILDSGMLNNYYDHAKLVKKSTSGLSLNALDRLLVTLDHFTHSHSSGVGFFSVDSYPVNDTTAGTDTSKIYTYEIPIFTSPTSGITYDLRDCIDIRPRIADTANSVSTLTGISKNPLKSTTFYNPTGCLKFSPSGEDFTTDAEYYLKRIDAVALSKTGTVQVIRGVPAVRPSSPAVPEDLMAIATISLAPYPSLPLEIARRVNRPDLSNTMRKIRNERYTMRDIGTIRDRVDRLEYYTSLNLLEKNTKDLLVPDTNGNDRFKNGILVDSFKGYAVANPFDADAIKWTNDPVLGECRPLVAVNEVVPVYNKNSTNIVRTNVTPDGISRDQIVELRLLKTEYVATINPNDIMDISGTTITSGGITATVRRWAQTLISDNTYGLRLYVENATGNFTAGGTISISNSTLSSAAVPIVSVTTTVPGDLVTLPYTHEVFVNQPYATTTRNCVGTAYNWMGTVTLTPDSDYWCDTVNRPDVNMNIDMNTDNMLLIASAWPTSYDAWQRSFTGKPVLVSQSEIDNGTVEVPNADGSRNIVQNFTTKSIYTTPATDVRTYNNLKAEVMTSKEVVGNFVKDVNIQPFMRSRMILFRIDGVKPGSRLYAFFDRMNVERYITPLTKDEYLSGGNGKPTGLGASKFAPLTYREGDPLIVSGSLTLDPATGLYMGNGTAYGIFRLPNDSSLRFHTGTKRIRFTDSPTNSTVLGQFTTTAEGEYTSEGLMAGISDLTLSTKKAIIAQQFLTESRNAEFNTTSLVGGQRIVGVIPAPPQDAGDAAVATSGGCGCGSGDDPIAQTFMISSLLTNKVHTTGIYVSKIDLFFATKDTTLPITFDIREVDPATGYITPRVVPFSRVVMQPNDINISVDGSAATPVYFSSPVYLAEDKEYSIVLIPAAANPNYNVFTAVIGSQDLLNPTVKITQQPASGFLFTSSNQRTWVPVENEDIKFTLYQAIFPIESTGNLILKNQERDYLTIANTTGAFNSIGEVVFGEVLLDGGFTNTATIIVANTTYTGTHFAHGQTSNAYGTITYWNTKGIRVRGVPKGRMFKAGETIKIRANDPTTGTIIGSNTSVRFRSATYPAGRVSYYDVVNYANTKLHISNTTFANSGPANSTNRMFTQNMTIVGQTNGYSGRILSIDNIGFDKINLQTNLIQPGNTTIYAYGKFATSTSTRSTDYSSIMINDDTVFDSTKYILSRSIESNTAASSSTMAVNKSAEIKYELLTNTKVCSPAIDLRRMGMITTRNLISSNTEIGSSEDWIKFGGNSKTRYITKRVSLADGQDAEDLRVYLTGYQPADGQIYVYAKILSGDDNDTFDDARWIPMQRDESQGFTAATAYSSSVNRNDFIEFTYKIPDFACQTLASSIFDASGRAINQYGANTTTGYVEYRNSSKARFVRFKYFAIKIVLTGSNSSNPPRVRELRAIALQR